MNHAVSVSAAELVSALGPDVETAWRAWEAGAGGLSEVPHPLRVDAPAAFPGEPSAESAPARGLPVLWGRIAQRAPLRGRRYGAASNLAVHVARRVAERAGWSAADLRGAWIFAASSRGNAAELLRANGWRRPLKAFSASNTLHSEIAAAVSIELGIHGPWQMLSNGCSSGLDALGWAWRAVVSGWTARALVIASELPLVPELLRDFADAGLLARDGANNPLSPSSSGFHPAEAGVALALERALPGAAPALCEITGYRANSDAYDALASPADGRGMARLFAESLAAECPALVCTHTTGTRSHAVSEEAALTAAFEGARQPLPPVLPLKGLTGHTLGASGLVDVALLAEAFRRGNFPALPPPLSSSGRMRVLDTPLTSQPGMTVWKAASGMGGHNALVSLRPPGQA